MTHKNELTKDIQKENKSMILRNFSGTSEISLLKRLQINPFHYQYIKNAL